jgi:hypothetical protein
MDMDMESMDDTHHDHQAADSTAATGGHGHSHDLDPALFQEFAATSEPLGTIMILHIFCMVIGKRGDHKGAVLERSDQ